MTVDCVGSFALPRDANAGPWPCLPNCLTHRGRSDTGADVHGECFAVETVGATRLSCHTYRGQRVKLEVTVNWRSERGVLDPPEVGIGVDPQGAVSDGLFVLDLNEATQHLLHVQQAMTREAPTGRDGSRGGGDG